LTEPPTPPDDSTPAARLIGRQLVSYDADTGVASLAFRAPPEFTNRHGGVQGGFLAAMLDSAAGQTVHATLGPGFSVVTRRLDVTFVRPAPIGPLNGAGRLVAQDEREARVETELATADGVVVARAVAELTIRRRSPAA
jgi:uncharacterized protein (TIGR00369 family)